MYSSQPNPVSGQNSPLGSSSTVLLSLFPVDALSVASGSSFFSSLRKARTSSSSSSSSLFVSVVSSSVLMSSMDTDESSDDEFSSWFSSLSRFFYVSLQVISL